VVEGLWEKTRIMKPKPGAQGIANIVAPVFGGMAVPALIGQSCEFNIESAVCYRLFHPHSRGVSVDPCDLTERLLRAHSDWRPWSRVIADGVSFQHGDWQSFLKMGKADKKR